MRGSVGILPANTLIFAQSEPPAFVLVDLGVADWLRTRIESENELVSIPWYCHYTDTILYSMVSHSL